MTSARTGFYLHPAASLHDTGWRHPEHQGRLRALASRVEKALPELHGRVEEREVREATLEDLLRVHTKEHLEGIRAAVQRAEREGEVVSLDQDTRVSSASWGSAVGSAGAAISACRDVLNGSVRNAFVAARPPGHHATPDRAMGFCLVNHVAVAARWLVRQGGVARVLIVDWDVHHGNGTQAVFEADPVVFYCSLHQAPHYPGTGAASETGIGAGEGTVLNVPLTAGTSRSAYRREFRRAVAEVRGRFAPDFLLVSSGFDVLAGDPLGGQLLEPEDLREMTRELVEWSADAFGGRVVVVLEGGYVPERLGDGVVEVLRGLLAPSGSTAAARTGGSENDLSPEDGV